MHRWAWTWAIWLACSVSIACTWTRQEELLLVQNLRVSDTTSTSITLRNPLVARRPRSELWLEIPALAEASDRPILETGAPLRLEIFVETKEARQFPLDHVASLDYSPRRFVVASSRLLEFPEAGQPALTITKIVLRSQPAVQIERAIWLSYDPREFKSGVTAPEGVR
jgi:hypothetical protein